MKSHNSERREFYEKNSYIFLSA